MAKKQGDEEPVESSIAEADARDMEALKQADKPANEPAEPDDGPVLEFAEDGADDGDSEPEQPRPSSEERRRNRVKEFEERTAAAERGTSPGRPARNSPSPQRPERSQASATRRT